MYINIYINKNKLCIYSCNLICHKKYGSKILNTLNKTALFKKYRT